MTIKVFNIDYEITEEDVYNTVAEKHPEIDEDSDEFEKLVNSEIDSTRKSLPTSLVLNLDYDVDEEDLDDIVPDEVSEQTGWLIRGCDYEIIQG